MVNLGGCLWDIVGLKDILDICLGGVVFFGFWNNLYFCLNIGSFLFFVIFIFICFVNFWGFVELRVFGVTFFFMKFDGRWSFGEVVGFSYGICVVGFCIGVMVFFMGVWILSFVWYWDLLVGFSVVIENLSVFL